MKHSSHAATLQFSSAIRPGIPSGVSSHIPKHHLTRNFWVDDVPELPTLVGYVLEPLESSPWKMLASRKTIHYFPIGFFCSLFVGELPSFKVEQMCPPKHFRKRSPPTDGTDRDLNIGAFQKFGSLIFRAEKLYFESQENSSLEPKKTSQLPKWLAINWMMNQIFTKWKWLELTIFHPRLDQVLFGGLGESGTQMALPFRWSLDPCFGGPPTFKNKGPWGSFMYMIPMIFSVEFCS